MLLTCAVTALALHGAGAWMSDTSGKIASEGGAGAVESLLGSRFANMAAGAAEPVSDSTVTPNRQAEDVVTPIKPGEALLPETARTTATPPEPQVAPVPLPEVAPETATPVAVALPSSAAILPRRPVEAAVAAPRDLVKAQPEEEGGLQASRRPQARPREIEEAAAARQSPEPERKAEVRGASGSNAPRDATRGSMTGHETASAVRQGRDTTSQSTEQGNAAVSAYPGLVLRHLARVPRPRADSRGAALVQFSIAEGGRLASVNLARSSGSTRLDRAALTVVQRAAPFPAPPRGAQRSFSIRIEGR